MYVFEIGVIEFVEASTVGFIPCLPLQRIDLALAMSAAVLQHESAASGPATALV